MEPNLNDPEYHYNRGYELFKQGRYLTPTTPFEVINKMNFESYVRGSAFIGNSLKI